MLPKLGERLRHGGGGIAVRYGHESGLVLADGLLELFLGKHGAPLALERNDLAAAAARDLGLEVAEASEDRHEHAIAGLDEQASAASIAARAVPSTRSVRRFLVWKTPR